MNKVIMSIITDLDSCRKVVEALRKTDPKLNYIQVDEQLWSKLVRKNGYSSCVDGSFIVIPLPKDDENLAGLLRAYGLEPR